LEAEEEAVAGLPVLAMGPVLFGAFSGAEGLAFNVAFCATPLELMPIARTATANENLIFIILNTNTLIL
jgi:hypothetical protein